MPTSGPLDQEFGQRSAFPIERDIVVPESGPTNGTEYVLQVRQEAEAMARRMVNEEIQPRPKRVMRRSPENSTLSYDEDSDFGVIEYTKQLLSIQDVRVFLELYAKAHEVVQARPIETCSCDSQATWKEFITNKDPLILDHATCFRVIKYLARWGRQQWTLNMAKWAWVVVLRLPDVLTAEETASIRDLVRTRDKANDQEIRQFLNAVARVAVDQYGQSDLK